ncbi:hypothetical protein CAPTEDRAFT_215190, partial [Capitella teleta]
MLLYRLKVSVSNPRDAFLNDLQDILECFIVKPKSFIILGDFNIHWDVEADRERMKLLDMAEAFQLVQHVKLLLGNCIHYLLLICFHNALMPMEYGMFGLTRSVQILLLYRLKVSVSNPRDHRAVHFSINAAKPHPPRKKITFRKLRNVVQVALKRDLREAVTTISINPSDEFDAEARLVRYDTTLRQLLDCHAPLIEAFVVQKPRAPWYTEVIAEAKRSRRRLEKQWKRTGLTVQHEMFKRQKSFVTTLISQTRSKFYCNKMK